MFEQKRQVIMLVDDNQANLSMGKNMLTEYYEVYALPSAERLFKFLESVMPDLILLDIEMPNMNGFDVIRILKADAKLADVPVIFVTSKAKETDELEGLDLGAVDYITKPFSAAILLKRIENHLLIKRQKAELRTLNENLIDMVKDKTSQVVLLQNSLVTSIAEIVEFRDNFTGEHITRTQSYVRKLIDYLLEHNIYFEEMTKWDDIDTMVSAAQLHDLGKIFVDGNILNKPGKLTPDEIKIMQTHVAKGVEAIQHMKKKIQEQIFLDSAETIAGTHHEKWDGSGYPARLKGDQIPLLGRLMAIADVYDALTSARPYKDPFSPEEAAEIIIDGSGSHFDPVLVEAFKKLKTEFAAIAREGNAKDIA